MIRARYVVIHRPYGDRGKALVKNPFQVFDAKGNWVCSRHSTLALAEKRAAELNAEVSA